MNTLGFPFGFIARRLTDDTEGVSKASQMLGSRPSAARLPSTWYAAVAVPHTNAGLCVAVMILP